MSDLQSLKRFDFPVCTPRTREVSKTRSRPPAPSWQARLGRGRARDDEGAFGPQSVGRKGHQEFEGRRVRSMARGKSPTYGTARAPAALWTMQHRSWRDSGRRATPDRVDALAARSFPTASSRRVSEHLINLSICSFSSSAILLRSSVPPSSSSRSSRSRRDLARWRSGTTRAARSARTRRRSDQAEITGIAEATTSNPVATTRPQVA